MSPGMWKALCHERHEELCIFDSFQARITSMIRATAMTKSKKRHKERDFRFFKDWPGSSARRVKSPSDLKAKFLGIASIVNAQHGAVGKHNG